MYILIGIIVAVIVFFFFVVRDSTETVKSQLEAFPGGMTEKYEELIMLLCGHYPYQVQKDKKGYLVISVTGLGQSGGLLLTLIEGYNEVTVNLIFQDVVKGGKRLEKTLTFPSHMQQSSMYYEIRVSIERLVKFGID